MNLYANSEDDNISKDLLNLIDEKNINKKFLEDRKIFLWEPVSSDSAKKLTSRLLYLDSINDEEITFYIHSPGGEVTSGFLILDTMELIQSPVKTVCMGMAASFGAILLSAGSKRAIFPRAKVMIHQPSLGGQFQGVSKDLEIQTREIIKIKRLSAEVLAKNCGKTEDEIMKDFDRDFWMDAKEAKEYGIIDEIVQGL